MLGDSTSDEDMVDDFDLVAADLQGIEGADLVQVLDAAIAEADGAMDHLAMWAEDLEDAALEGLDALAAAEGSVAGAMAHDPAVQQQPPDAAGPAAQAMVAFLQATLALPAPRTESPEDGGRKRSRAEGLSAADARELCP